MKILFTGAGGFLGQGLVKPFARDHDLRLIDIADFETGHEKLMGDVSDLDTALRSVEGVDAIVIAHMASRQAGAYENPSTCFDANVRGTANLFFAANKLGVNKVCLISSTGAVSGNPDGMYLTRNLYPKGRDMYTLTKACQEVIAEQYHRICGIKTAVLRVGGIIDTDEGTNKYGIKKTDHIDVLVDRRDIGTVAKLALELPNLEYEVFYVYGCLEADEFCDAGYTRKRLQWTPRYQAKDIAKKLHSGAI